MAQKNKTDMINGNPTTSLIAFTLPVILGNLFQQLYNIVDSVVVGRCVGEEALAAVGTSSSITFLFIAIATGLSIGSGVVISQLFGAQEYKRMKTSIYTSLVSIVAISSLLTIVGVLMHMQILRIMNTPAQVMDDAAVYLKIYFYGLVFLFLYNVTNAVFNALGRSKIPLVFLTFSSVLNIVLDLVFVIRYHMGVAGVAWATLISQALSALGSLIVLLRLVSKFRTEERASVFHYEDLRRIGTVALPSMIQQSIVSVGIVCVQSLVNSFGSVVMAGYAAASKIDNIAINPMVNIGNAVSTFTAQNIGAGKVERVKQGYRAGILMNAVICTILLGIVVIFGRSVIGMFMDGGTANGSIEIGVEYIRVVYIFYFLMGFMNVTNGVLRGAGDIGYFMFATLCNFVSRVALAYIMANFIGMRAVWWSIPLGWMIGLVVSRARYRSGKWKSKSLVDGCYKDD